MTGFASLSVSHPNQRQDLGVSLSAIQIKDIFCESLCQPSKSNTGFASLFVSYPNQRQDLRVSLSGIQIKDRIC